MTLTQTIDGNTCYHQYLVRTNAYVDLNHEQYCRDCNNPNNCINPENHFIPIVRFEIPLNPVRFK